MTSRSGVELPPYRALLVVDMKDFSGRESRDHQSLTEQIPDILANGFAAAGLRHEWADRAFSRTTGDGYVAGFRSALLPRLLNPLLGAMQQELLMINRSAAAGTPPIRMRVSLHVGPVTDSGANAEGDGSGAARVEAHRLVDAPEVKALLTRSADVTCVAAIISERVFEDAVLSGYTGEGVERYVRVPVRVKSYEGVAYLRVPEPSGDLLASGFSQPATDGEPDAGSRPRDCAGTERARTVITTSYGPVHAGDGDQFNDLGNAHRRPGRRDR